MMERKIEIVRRIEELVKLLEEESSQVSASLHYDGGECSGLRRAFFDPRSKSDTVESEHQLPSQAFQLHSPSIRRIEGELRHRRRLCDLLGFDLVADPVWTMVLELLLAETKNERISVTSLGFASGVAQTTALRWIGIMEAKGILERQPDNIDRRRTYVTLTQDAKVKASELLDRHC